MSHKPVYCECSKPDSSKHCRISCGLPQYPGDNRWFDENDLQRLKDMDKAAFEELHLGKWVPPDADVDKALRDFQDIKRPSGTLRHIKISPLT